VKIMALAFLGLLVLLFLAIWKAGKEKKKL
jgi:hypothetical protein